MNEKKLTINDAFDELAEARTDVEEAQAALEKAETVKTEKVDQIKTMMDDLKAKAKELGLELVANVDEAKDAVQEKLNEAKEEFAEEAAESPNAARRKLRLIWGVIGAVVGAAGGFGAGYLYCLIG